MTKMRFTDLDSDTQEAVLANQSIPHFEQAITAAATSANQPELTRLTNLYNEARGLPVADETTTGTSDTPDGGTPSAATYTGADWKRDALEEEALHERNLDVVGTGRDGYVTNNDYRAALTSDDEDRANQEGKS